MNVLGDDHQGTEVELARDGEEVHCWQTSLEEVETSVFGFCISVFGHKLQYIMSEEFGRSGVFGSRNLTPIYGKKMNIIFNILKH